MTRRLVPLVSVVVALTLASAARASASVSAPLRTTAPLTDARTHRPLSCPDPTVIHAPRGRWNYFLYCTSDRAPGAFPIYGSPDLVDWTPLGDVFAPGHEPGFALPTGGRGDTGRFWAPSINRIAGRWVLYFAAAYDPASHALPTGAVDAGTMVLGVATSSGLTGPWHASLLHYPGELNAEAPPIQREAHGGDIDPAQVQDPVTGQRLLVWTEQRAQIWIAGLSRDGLRLEPQIHRAFVHSEPWECDPGTRTCTVEGAQPLFHDGRLFVLYSGASTWDSSYAVGAASAPTPFSPFVKDPEPILRSGGGFLGPGGVSDPTVAPDGRSVVLYHVLRAPDPGHRSGERLLMLGTLGWGAGGRPTIDDGTP